MKMHQPQISVIVPVFNVERFLSECLDSILSQTFEDFEVICVNDGSTDSSLHILDGYSKKDPRIKIVCQENKGLSGARNTGLNLARGKYIYFIDSDDFIYPETLQILYDKAESFNSEITICNMKLWFHDTKSWGYYRDEILFFQRRHQLLNLNNTPEIISCVAAWDRLIRKSFLDDNKISFLEGLVYEDVPFCMDCYTKAQRIVLVPDHLYCYRKNAGGSITDNEARAIKCRRDFITTRLYAKTVLERANVSSEVWFHYLNHFIDQALMHNRNCENKQEFKEFFNKVRSLMNEELYAVMNRVSNQQHFGYIQALAKNDVDGAFKLV